MAVIFTPVDLTHTLRDSRRVKRWLLELTEEEGRALGDVTIIWCSDSYLLDVNRKYLDHDYFTDIITFDYSSEDFVSGDLFVSLDRVRANAADYAGGKNLFHVELRRVMAHGLLHLCGYGDKTDSEAKIMRAKEDYYLAKYDALVAAAAEEKAKNSPYDTPRSLVIRSLDTLL